jgi:hypothetical protein
MTRHLLGAMREDIGDQDGDASHLHDADDDRDDDLSD